ncbi:MAG: type II toxin-antitoxin system VapB family antitoxin [Tepidisphaeraceae bacterium]
MKTTVDIPDDVLAEVMRNTGAATKREAILTAIREHNRRAKVDKLVATFGTWDNFMTQEDRRRLRGDSEEELRAEFGGQQRVDRSAKTARSNGHSGRHRKPRKGK